MTAPYYLVLYIVGAILPSTTPALPVSIPQATEAQCVQSGEKIAREAERRPEYKGRAAVYYFCVKGQ